jgi:hypothetical protein
MTYNIIFKEKPVGQTPLLFLRTKCNDRNNRNNFNNFIKYASIAPCPHFFIRPKQATAIINNSISKEQ